MKPLTLTPKPARQRKMLLLLLLPLVVLLFTTLLFYSLGGGKAFAQSGSARMQGLNTQLPDASLGSGKPLSKMSYYEKAAADSFRIRQQLKSDPYFRMAEDKDSGVSHLSAPPLRELPATPYPDLKNSASTPIPATGQSQQIYQKLARLQKIINAPAAEAKPVDFSTLTGKPVDRTFMSKEEPAGDPELKQLSSLLDKILEIQHPEKTADKPLPDTATFRAIPAVIDGRQKITQGTVVRLRLLDSVRLAGVTIPKGQPVFGSGILYNQRYSMKIRLIRLGYTIVPVDLTVFDMKDGMEGISVPEAVTGEELKEGAAGSMQGLDLMSSNPSVTTQLAGASINMAKGLFTKKVRMVKGKLHGGHLVLLRDNSRHAGTPHWIR